MKVYDKFNFSNSSIFILFLITTSTLIMVVSQWVWIEDNPEQSTWNMRAFCIVFKIIWKTIPRNKNVFTESDRFYILGNWKTMRLIFNCYLVFILLNMFVQSDHGSASGCSYTMYFAVDLITLIQHSPPMASMGFYYFTALSCW